MDKDIVIKKRQLPKLMACMTKASLENLRSKALFSLDFLDAKGIRRYVLYNAINCIFYLVDFLLHFDFM